MGTEDYHHRRLEARRAMHEWLPVKLITRWQKRTSARFLHRKWSECSLSKLGKNNKPRIAHISDGWALAPDLIVFFFSNKVDIWKDFNSLFKNHESKGASNFLQNSSRQVKTGPQHRREGCCSPRRLCTGMKKVKHSGPYVTWAAVGGAQRAK